MSQLDAEDADLDDDELRFAVMLDMTPAEYAAHRSDEQARAWPSDGPTGAPLSEADEEPLTSAGGFYGHTAVYRIESQADWIVVGDHAVVPSRFTVVMDPVDLPQVEMDVEVTATGRPRCTRLVLHPPKGAEITTALLRLPLRRLLRDALSETLEKVIVADGKLKPGTMSSRDVEAYRASLEAGVAPPAQLDSQSAKTLRRVAEIYRAAGRAPTKAVGEELGYSRPHAGRLVMEARQQVDPLTGRPYLGAALGTKAGEAPPSGAADTIPDR